MCNDNNKKRGVNGKHSVYPSIMQHRKSNYKAYTLHSPLLYALRTEEIGSLQERNKWRRPCGIVKRASPGRSVLSDVEHPLVPPDCQHFITSQMQEMAHNDARFFSLPEGETILQLVSLVTLPLSLRVLPPFFRFTESIALANIVE